MILNKKEFYFVNKAYTFMSNKILINLKMRKNY